MSDFETNITPKIIAEFNRILASEGVIFRLNFDKIDGFVTIIPANRHWLANDGYINPSKDFYEYLEAFFFDKGVSKLRYNNTGDTFWEDFSSRRRTTI